MFSNAENLGKVGSGSILIKRLGDLVVQIVVGAFIRVELQEVFGDNDKVDLGIEALGF